MSSWVNAIIIVSLFFFSDISASLAFFSKKNSSSDSSPRRNIQEYPASPLRFCLFRVATMTLLQVDTDNPIDYGHRLHAANICNGLPMQPSFHRVTCQYTNERVKLTALNRTPHNRGSFHVDRIYGRQNSDAVSSEESACYQNFWQSRQPISQLTR